MGRKLTQKEAEKVFLPHYVLCEKWAGYSRSLPYKFFDVEKQIYVWVLATIARGGPRKSFNPYPRMYHGCTHKSWYNSYESMKRRCQGKGSQCYINKHIIMCKEWEDLRKFGEWAESHGFRKGLTIDRIDANGNYCPENCQWISLSENVARSHISSPRNRDLKGKFIQLGEK